MENQSCGDLSWAQITFFSTDCATYILHFKSYALEINFLIKVLSIQSFCLEYVVWNDQFNYTNIFQKLGMSKFCLSTYLDPGEPGPDDGISNGFRPPSKQHRSELYHQMLGIMLHSATIISRLCTFSSFCVLPILYNLNNFSRAGQWLTSTNCNFIN